MLSSLVKFQNTHWVWSAHSKSVDCIRKVTAGIRSYSLAGLLPTGEQVSNAISHGNTHCECQFHRVSFHCCLRCLNISNLKGNNHWRLFLTRQGTVRHNTRLKASHAHAHTYLHYNAFTYIIYIYIHLIQVAIFINK